MYNACVQHCIDGDDYLQEMQDRLKELPSLKRENRKLTRKVEELKNFKQKFDNASQKIKDINTNLENTETQLEECRIQKIQLTQTLSTLRNQENQTTPSIKFVTEFSANTCFKIFDLLNIEMCLLGGKKVMPPYKMSYEYSGSHVTLGNWYISVDRCVDNKDKRKNRKILEICIKDFKDHDIEPCLPVRTPTKINKKIHIDTKLTTEISSEYCLKIFAEKHKKMCLRDNIYVLSQDQFAQCSDGDFCVYPKPWLITHSDCIEPQQILDICIESFKDEGIERCCEINPNLEPLGTCS